MVVAVLVFVWGLLGTFVIRRWWLWVILVLAVPIFVDGVWLASLPNTPEGGDWTERSGAGLVSIIFAVFWLVGVVCGVAARVVGPIAQRAHERLN